VPFQEAKNRILGVNQGSKNVNEEFIRKYGWLHIEKREKSTLSVEDCINFLLEKNLLQAGIEKQCPNYISSFWVSLNDINERTKCPYCFYSFSFSKDLNNKNEGNWKIKPSGMIAMDEQGSIPLVMLLQQMETAIGYPLLYTTSLNLEPLNNSRDCNIDKCETDFIILSPHLNNERIQITIGEYKSHGPIEEKEVLKLKKLLEFLDKKNVDTFVIFTKLSNFSREEIKLCKQLQSPYRQRVVLLTKDQLEPYCLKKNRELPIFTLAEMAQNTHELYLNAT